MFLSRNLRRSIRGLMRGSQRVAASVLRRAVLASALLGVGSFRVECVGPDGVVRWSERLPNGITNAGLTLLLNVMFTSGVASANWYIGLLGGTGTLAAADTMSSHSGWTEVTAYDEAARQAWGVTTTSNQSLSNGTQAEFTVSSDSTTVKGIFVVSDSTKGGTSGTLWSTGLFATEKNLDDDDVLRVTYTVTAAAA